MEVVGEISGRGRTGGVMFQSKEVLWNRRCRMRSNYRYKLRLKKTSLGNISQFYVLLDSW